MLKRCLFLFLLKNFSHKGEKVRSELVRKRKAILGFGLVWVPKREWTERCEEVEATVALLKRERSASSLFGGGSGTCLGGRI